MVMVKTIGIIGGDGHFGRHARRLIRRFASKVKVCAFDVTKKANGGVFTTLEQVCMCDVVVLSVPPRAYENVIREIVPIIKRLNPLAIIVDIATVKEHTRNLLRQYAEGIFWLCCHPNFGPGAYKNRRGNVRGFKIALVDHSMPADVVASLLMFVKRLGFVVELMTAEEHDRISAWTLYLAHRTSQIWKAAGVQRTTFDTTSFSSMKDGAEMVEEDTDLFNDVRRYNRFCAEVDVALARAEAQVLQSRSAE